MFSSVRACVCGLLILLHGRCASVFQRSRGLHCAAVQEGIYSLFYSCSSSPDWLWQGGDEGEELFSSAGSSIIPVTPNRQKESSRGNLPSVSSGRRREGGREEEEKRGKIVVGQSLPSLCNLVDYDQFPWYRWPPWPWATLPTALCMVRALCTMTWLTLHHTGPNPWHSHLQFRRSWPWENINSWVTVFLEERDRQKNKKEKKKTQKTRVLSDSTLSEWNLG